MANIPYEDRRGVNKKEDARKNKQAILDWFIAHPNETQKACAASLGLSTKTVSTHLKTIIAEQK